MLREEAKQAHEPGQSSGELWSGEATCFLSSSGSLPDYVPDVGDTAVNGQTQGLLSWSFWSHLGDLSFRGRIKLTKKKD